MASRSPYVVDITIGHIYKFDTPQEAEQLSELASDDFYVQKQKEDIQELASMFKDCLQFYKKYNHYPSSE